jgi:8-amino-7-oxononanoate synthase
MSFEKELQSRLNKIRDAGLHRELRCVDSPQGPRIKVRKKTLLNFSSNDYLGLANEPAIKEAAIKAIEKFGAGAGASRLICGSLAAHHELEETLASFKKTQAALTFSSGYATAIGSICALVGKGDVIILDKLVHASIVDAARSSGATIRVFPHNNLDALEKILKSVLRKTAHSSTVTCQRLVVTESVFSMDGDHAPLREIVELKNKFGAWLMVDEAHATGLYGKNRRGLAEEIGVSDQIEIQMGTMGKALGASGGYICGSRKLIDFLINRARSFIFSTAPVPAAAAAAMEGIRFVQSEAGKKRCALLWQRATELNSKLKIENRKLLSAIIPILIGDENQAVQTSNDLLTQGIFVPAIRYPTVARGKARLRVTFTASHTSKDVERLALAIESIRHRESTVLNA